MNLSSNLSADKKPFFASTRFFWAAALAAAALAVFFRFYPLTVYPAIAAQNQAELIVFSNLRKQVGAEGMKRVLDTQKIKIRSTIREVTQKIRARQRAAHKTPYLMEVDPYYYLSLTERLVRGEAVFAERNGRLYRNTRMMAPEGAWYPIDAHPYIGAAVYLAGRLLRRDLSVAEAVGWVPVLLAILCLVPLFLIARGVFSLQARTFFLGGAYLVLCPIYLQRSLWGWYDTDSYNIFFPGAILFCLFLFFKETVSGGKGLRMVFWAAAICSVYSLFWRGWLLEHALISAGFLAGGLILRNSVRDKIAWPLWLAYPVLPVAFSCLVWGPAGFTGLLTEAGQMVSGFVSPHFSVWPDVFLTVGELRNSNPTTALKALGGAGIAVVCFFGIFARLLDRNERTYIRCAAALTGTLLLIAIFLGTKLERFTLLAVVPAAIALMLGIEKAVTWTRARRRPIFLLAQCVFLALVGWSIIKQAHLSVRYERPIYNDAWENIAAFFRAETPPDSIVTSWWSPGHFITAAGRRVTFDGATQNTPRAYWTANLFLEPSESKAASILRMLDLSGDGALAFLQKRMALSKGVALLHRLLPLAPDAAAAESEKILNAQDTQTLLGFTHGDSPPPAAYVLIYNDMVDKAMALEYIGKWDFAKAELFAERLKKDPAGVPKNLLKRSSKERIRHLWSLAEGPYAQGNESYETARRGDVVAFGNGLSVDMKTMGPAVESPDFGKGAPRNLYWMNGGKLEKKEIAGATLGISALLIRDDGPSGPAWRSVLADERLIESLLFKLYYLKGEGLKFFTLVKEEDNVQERTKLYVFRVNWTGNRSDSYR